MYIAGWVKKLLTFSCCSEFFDIVIKPDPICQLKKLNSLSNSSFKFNRLRVVSMWLSNLEGSKDNPSDW
jgi:hypothetical protein